MFKRDRKKRRLLATTLKKISYIAIFVIFLSLTILILKSNFFSVKNFSCRQDTTDYCSTKLYEFLEQYRGKNIFSLSENEVKNNIKKNFSQAREIIVKKKLPSSLTLSIKAKKPSIVVILTNKTGDSFATSSAQLMELTKDPTVEEIYLDSEGEMVEITKENFPTESLPTLVLNLGQEAKSRHEKTQSLIFAVKTAEYLIKNIYPFKIGQISDTKMSIFLQDTQIIFSTKNLLAEQLESLQLILSRAKISGIKYQKIDLRFDKPVVVQKNNGKK